MASSPSPLPPASKDLPVVLIVGASFGGLSVAKRLLQNGGASHLRVILLDAKDSFSIGGLWQFVWNGRLTMDQVTWPLKDAQLPGVDLRTQTTVTQWKPQDKTVLLLEHDGTTQSLVYDHMVLACGVVPDPITIPGLDQYVNVCSMEMVERQRRELQQLIATARSTSTPPSATDTASSNDTNARPTFVYCITTNPYKCPPAPFELTFLVDEALRQAGVRDKCRVVISCPVDWPMPPVTETPFHDTMNKKGIEFWKEHVPRKMDQDGTIHYTNGTTLQATVIWSSWPIRAPDFVRDAVPVNPKGFVTVLDKVIHTIPNVPNAHVIGDCCSVPFGPRFALPKAGEFAWRMGESVADALLVQAVVEDDTTTTTNLSDASSILANRSGDCVAETGFDEALVLHPNFSDVCNDPENGKPKMTLDAMEQGGPEGKIAWANEYLTKVFGPHAEVSLSCDE